MEGNLFKYIWRHSKRHQLWLLVVVIASMPFIFLSYELPKQIVNGPIQGEGFDTPGATATFLRLAFTPPEWISSGGEIVLFSGFDMARMPYLSALCVVFLSLVCINGLFKFYINTYKGRLGERMLRRMRYELIDRLLRFPIAQFRRVKAPEMATMVKDEVEPLGEFIGDAFVLPLFQGGQALVALFFILNQNFWLGGIALAVVLGQAILIPRLRRQLLVLTKQRQLAARALAGRVGEVVDGIDEIHVNDTSNFERADITSRLGRIFFIRYELYQRKYFIKFLNNFLAQFTPFLFYFVGGYFAIRGSLDIGQLIAVIAAYKDLPSPIRELINWDQKRLDVQIKYTQVIEQFDVDNILEPERQSIPEVPVPPLSGDISVSNLAVVDDTGAKLIERTSFQLPVTTHAAAVGLVNSGAESTADVLARLLLPTSGRVQIGSCNYDEAGEAVTGRRVAYVGVDTYLPQGSVIDNVLYGLKHAPVRPPEEDRDEIDRALEISEARRSGNALFDVDADWIDYEAIGVAGPDALKAKVAEILDVVSLAEDIFELGLRGRIDPDEHPGLAAEILTARRALRDRIGEAPLKDLVEPFDPEVYNHQATLVENLMFGTAVDDAFTDARLANNPYMLDVLAKTELDAELFNMGREIAETVTELFSDLPEDHPFFEQLSFMTSEEIPDYQKALTRTAGIDFDKVKSDDQSMLLKLPFAYIEPRHRLGLLTDELEAKILAARKLFREDLPEETATAIEFYDPETYNKASSLEDNILFGRIAYGMAKGPQVVRETVQAMLMELDLRDAVFETGLHFNVGSGGKRLSVLQRQKIGLARALIKLPDLLIVNRALSSLDTKAQERLIDAILTYAGGAEGGRRIGVFWVLQNPAFATKFEHVLVFEDGALAEEGVPGELAGSDSKLAALAG